MTTDRHAPLHRSPGAAAPERPARRRWSRCPLVLCGVVLLGGAALAHANRDYLLYRFACVRDGVLFRSGQMDEETLERVVREHRIRTVVNLMTTDAHASRAVSARLACVYRWLPSTQVPPPEVVGAFLSIMDDPANRPVLIHCEHGVGRTGVLTAIYRMEYEGVSCEDAIAEARRVALWGSFGAGQDKRLFLESYVCRRLRRAATPGERGGSRVPSGGLGVRVPARR